MKRSIETGVRNTTLEPMVCDEIRALTLSARSNEAYHLSFGELIMRSLWIMLVADHGRLHHTAPERDDCEAYRLLAELIVGDAISSIDEKIRSFALSNTVGGDAMLAQARSLKRYTDGLMAEEAARAAHAVDQVFARARAYSPARNAM
jgi:hypothetical protein